MVTTRRMFRGEGDERKRQPFRLLDLPPELWSEIGNVVIGATPYLHIRDIDNTSPLAKLGGTETWHQPPITRVCKALRHELLPQYYSAKVHSSPGVGFLRDQQYLSREKKSLRGWLHAIGQENRKNIQGLIFYGTVLSVNVDELKKRWGLDLELLGGKVETPYRRMYHVRFLYQGVTREYDSGDSGLFRAGAGWRMKGL